MSIRTDQLLGKLFRVLDEKVGMKNIIVVLSADHGVASTPHQNEVTKMPGGYAIADPEDAVQSALTRKFGKGAWVVGGAGETTLYLNHETIANMKASESEVYATAKRALLDIPQLHVARVYTRPQLESGVTGDFIAQAETNGFYPSRSGDIALVLEPSFVTGTSGTTHFSPYAYDRHVPVLFMGPGIRAGRYDETIQPNDIAPTLATMLEVQTPSGSSGRVLTEMLLH